LSQCTSAWTGGGIALTISPRRSASLHRSEREERVHIRLLQAWLKLVPHDGRAPAPPMRCLLPANRNALSARAVRRHVRAPSWSTRAQFLLPLNQGFLRRRPKADQARKPALSFASSRARVETNGIRIRGKTMMQNFKYIIQGLSLGFERIVMAWI